MTLKTPYLAAENSALARRSGALHRFLVASPIALMLVVGLVSHMPRAPYPHPAGDRVYDQKVLAYRERVVAVQAMDGAERPSDDALVREGEAWREGYASGRLTPIAAAVFEDHFRDGVRGEIVRTGHELSSALALCAETDFKAGRARSGAEKATLAAEIAFGMRGFDLQAHIQSLLIVRRATGLLIHAWPTVPPATKAALQPRLRALLIEGNEIDRLADVERVQMIDYAKRQRLPLPSEIATRAKSPGESLGNETTPALGAARRGVQFSNARVEKLLSAESGGGRP